MVVDDHPMWRRRGRARPDGAGFRWWRPPANRRRGDHPVRRARPKVVVLDLQIPEPDGVQVTTEIIALHPMAKVLILSASGEQNDVLDAVKAGATGYLVKSASRDELLEAVRRVAAGDPVFTPGLAGLVLGEFRRSAATEVRGTSRAHRPRDRDPQARRQGPELPPDRRPPRALPSHGAEPRTEHLAQAPDAQPGRAHPLRHRAGPGRGRVTSPNDPLLERPTSSMPCRWETSRRRATRG